MREGAGGRSPANPERWLAFTPRDTVVVRDGRSFDAGADASAESVWPWPSTIAGAVRAAYGAEPESVRGPVLARRTGTGGWSLHFPVPADVVQRPGGSPRGYLLRPDPELAGISTDLGDQAGGLLSPPRDLGKVEQVSGWVDAEALSGYLRGGLRAAGFDLDKPTKVQRGHAGLRRYRAPRTDFPDPAFPDPDPLQPLLPETRVGLARTRDRGARDGYLYQAIHLRPRDGWAFLACCDLAADQDQAARGPTAFGGRGRTADVADVTWQPGVGWPQAPDEFPDGRVLLYLATPALWPGGWRPPIPPEARLAGAAVPAPKPVATASPYSARRDRRPVLDTVTLRWAVPAGAVYLLEFADPAEAKRWASVTHARPLGPSLAERLDTAGFGVVLTGLWKAAEK
jgi:CRISPR type III-B/RAMP module-associated protein Cmr3